MAYIRLLLLGFMNTFPSVNLTQRLLTVFAEFVTSGTVSPRMTHRAFITIQLTSQTEVWTLELTGQTMESVMATRGTLLFLLWSLTLVDDGYLAVDATPALLTGGTGSSFNVGMTGETMYRAPALTHQTSPPFHAAIQTEKCSC